MVSKFRPKAPNIVATTTEKDMRRLALSFGAYAMLTEIGNSTDEVFDLSVNKALEAGYIKHGDLVIITAGVPVGVAGTTNTIKVHIAGKILVKGMGIGNAGAVGNVCIAMNATDAKNKFKEGEILVTIATDKEMVPFMEKAAAIITEKGGLTSHAAIVGLNIHKPVIVGATNVTKLLRNGDVVTVDSIRGLVYSGKANVL
jgi:pyruvate kinase